MNGIIGKQEHMKEHRFSISDRSELLRLSEENRLGDVYEFIINRMNEYELSLQDGRFYCGMLEQEMSFNYVTCLLRNDVKENCPIAVTGALASKLIKLFLRALVECCEEDGVVELDARDVLRRSAVMHHRSQAGT